MCCVTCKWDKVITNFVFFKKKFTIPSQSAKVLRIQIVHDLIIDRKKYSITSSWLNNLMNHFDNKDIVCLHNKWSIPDANALCTVKYGAKFNIRNNDVNVNHLSICCCFCYSKDVRLNREIIIFINQQ